MGDRNASGIELLEYVARSPCRVWILERLCETGPASRAELQADVDVVRTTLQRNLNGLAERGLVREIDRTYELTSAGSLVASGVCDALELVEPAVELRPVLEQLPTDTFGFDLERLADATVVEATTPNPYAPAERHARRLAGADEIRLLLPVAGGKPVETSREVVEDGMSQELVVTPSVAETLRTEPSIKTQFEEITEIGDVTVSEYDGEIPFFLGIHDEIVQIGVVDGSGMPTALLESTDPTVREWAADCFEEYKQHSERIW